jgi:HEXXH motif-containing protein
MLAPDGEPAARLTALQLAQLARVLRAAWDVLDPRVAADIAALARMIVPYTAPGGGHVSTSSPEAFGAIAMSPQPDPFTCAETLVHEAQHLKLCGLLDLVSLTGPDDGRRYYAPWRTDPRPLSGLLQGAYAFLGVGEFWRRQRLTAAEDSVRWRGHQLFARWRAGVGLVVSTLLDSGQLTPAGREFAGQMAGVLAQWEREPVPPTAMMGVRQLADQHLARWRSDHGDAYLVVAPGS